MADWTPGASLDILQQRAGLLARIREFFAARQVLEVETPLLSRSTVTDVFIQSLSVSSPSAGSPEPFFLQTSPEFAMKRLLAHGSGPIYQICKAFRYDEVSRCHNPEFTMLEWYRPGFSMDELMDEVEQLLRELLACGPIPRIPYRDLFEQHLGVDPHRARAAELRDLLREQMELASEDLSTTDCLQLLMSTRIEPQLAEYCFVHDYPVAQAALAELRQDDSGQAVACRFELYGQGMELANGYQELTDSREQRQRFEADLATRRRLGLPTYTPDHKLLAALEHGLPRCAGVALGVDRLLMLHCQLPDIEQAISFSLPRC